MFFVIEDRCRKDGICASVCPAHIIKGAKGSVPFLRPGMEKFCIACGHCMAFCPHGAARVEGLPLDDFTHIDRKLLPDAQAVELLCKARRSIRHFKKEPVPVELLERVLAVARHAPSAKNIRPVRFIVAYERKLLQSIGDHVADWLTQALERAGGNPALPEAKGLIRAWRMGLDPLFRGAPHLVLAATEKEAKWGLTDAAIALTYVELAALPHGIGACWAGYVTTAARNYAPLQALLGLGESEVIQGGQMLGFIALRPTASAPRTPLPVHWLQSSAE